MVAGMVGHARLGEKASCGRDVAPDAAFRLLVPTEIEGRVGREELHMGVGQVVVDPPSHGLPRRTRFIALDEPGNDDTSGRSHAALCIPPIPYMAGVIPLRRRAVVSPAHVLDAIVVDRDGVKRGTNRHVAEGGVKGLEQLLAQALSRRDG